MAISYVNTDEVQNITRELDSLANDLNNEINNLFNRFQDVPYVTKEWVGPQAEYFFKKIYEDKKDYNLVISKIKELSFKLKQDVNEIHSCENKCLENETR